MSDTFRTWRLAKLTFLSALLFGLCNAGLPAGAANLLVNGDFEAGNVGFETDYQLIPAGGQDPGPGNYVICSDPNDYNGFFMSYGDHTSGSGLMLLADCATSTTPSLWRERVTVAPGSEYTFSFWAANPYPGIVAVLRVYVNGQQIGADFPLNSTPGQWKQFSATWNAGVSNQAVIEIRDAVTAYVGNDVTLDDLALEGIEAPLAILTQPLDQYVWVGDTATFWVVASGGSLGYQWAYEGNPIPGQTNSSLVLSNVGVADMGHYAVQVSGSGGTLISSNALLAVQSTKLTGNVLVNGDFEMGNVGFETDYQLIPAGGQDPGPGYYAICSDPLDYNGFFTSYGDHTSGSGLMLLADCATSTTPSLWRERVTVAPGSEYTFSFWAANPYPGIVAVLRVYVNGQQIGADFPLNSTPGQWKQFSATWNAGVSNQAVIEIRDAVTAYVGNDVTLDDLAFLGPVLDPVLVTQPHGRRVAADSIVEFSAEALGALPLTFQWTFEGADLVGETNSTLVIGPVDSSHAGNYAVRVQNRFGEATSSNAVLEVNHAPIADAGATTMVVVSSDGLGAAVVLDGSLSSDPDGDTLTYAWYQAGEADPFAAGIVAVTTLPVGVHQLALVVDDGMATDRQDFAVEVITTDMAVGRLADLVEQGVSRPQPLLASLLAALRMIDRSQPEVAINQLEAFKNKVLAQVMPADSELAEQLLADAQAIIDAINAGLTEVVPLQITSIERSSNGKPKLRIRGPSDRMHVVEMSTNLVDWAPVGVAKECGELEFEFVDEVSAASPVRYYRVVAPQ